MPYLAFYRTQCHLAMRSSAEELQIQVRSDLSGVLILEPSQLIRADDKPRVDDWRVLSGLISINCNGLRWRDAPKEYGPPKTLYNRWKRWGFMQAVALRPKEWLRFTESGTDRHLIAPIVAHLFDDNGNSVMGIPQEKMDEALAEAANAIPAAVILCIRSPVQQYIDPSLSLLEHSKTILEA